MTFAEWIAKGKEVRMVLGPWAQHRHGYGCDLCTTTDIWWYRPDVNGYDGIIVYTEADKADADERAAFQGHILCDT